MTSHEPKMNVNAIRDSILIKLDSAPDIFGVSYYALPSLIGYELGEVEACATDLEDRGFIESQAEGKINITSRGRFFINSNSFTLIEKNKQIENDENNIDRELQRDNWITTTKTSIWAIWLSILSLSVAILALYVAWKS